MHRQHHGDVAVLAADHHRLALGGIEQRLAAVLDAAQREPVVIRRQNRDVAVVLSMQDYERMRGANVEAFLELRDRVAADAAARGLTSEKLAEILADDE